MLLYSPSASPAVRAALTARGWAVQLVSTLAEGKQALGAAAVDLVILDDPSWAQAKEMIAMLAAQAERFIEPRLARASTTPLFASGSSPAVRTAPRAARGSGEWDDESTGEWP